MNVKKNRFISKVRDAKREGGYTVIIPAAGIGQRMKGLGPKCLLQLSQKDTILSRQLDLIDNHIQPDEIIVVGGFEIEEIYQNLNRRARLIFNENFSTTNVVHSIYLGLMACVSPNVIVVYGDLAFNDHAIRNLKNVDFITTVIDNAGIMNDREIGIIQNGDEVANFSFAGDKKWGQITSFPAKTVSQLRQILKNRDTSNAYLFEILNIFIEKEVPVEICRCDSQIIDIDTVDDLNRAKNFFYEKTRAYY